jgi:hypothetical protein
MPLVLDYYINNPIKRSMLVLTSKFLCAIIHLNRIIFRVGKKVGLQLYSKQKIVIIFPRKQTGEFLWLFLININLY